MTLFAAAIGQGLLLRSYAAAIDPDWTTPLPPFRIAGNLYYVGSRDLASYLIATPDGHILINGNIATSPPQIRASIQRLGFRYRDIKILLISHAHYDHCAGCARIQQETKARYLVMEGDADVVESGGKLDFLYGRRSAFWYPPAKVDHVLRDGDQVNLGGASLTAHKTAGHTKGCTTWTLAVPAGAPSATGQNVRMLNAVILGGPNVNSGSNLIYDPRYPQMATDFTLQFCKLNTLPCDLFLGAHGSFYNLLEKYARLQSAATKVLPNPFIDPTGYKNYIADRQRAFQKELDRQIQKKK